MSLYYCYTDTAKSPLFIFFQLIVLFWWYSSKREYLVICMASAWYALWTYRNVAFFAETVTLSVDTFDWMWINRTPYKGVPQGVVFEGDEGDSVVGFPGVSEMFTNTRHTQAGVTEVTMALNFWRSTFSTGKKELPEIRHVDLMLCKKKISLKSYIKLVCD